MWNEYTKVDQVDLPIVVQVGGMRWDQENAESIMGLAAIYHSGLWQTYRKIECEAA